MKIELVDLVKKYVLCILLVIGIFVMRQEHSLIGLCDSVTVIGIAYLIVAMFLTAKKLRFYDLSIYSFKKFVKLWKKDSREFDELGDYYQYMNRVTHDERFLEYYIVSFTCLIISAVIAQLI